MYFQLFWLKPIAEQWQTCGSKQILITFKSEALSEIFLRETIGPKLDNSSMDQTIHDALVCGTVCTTATKNAGHTAPSQFSSHNKHSIQ
jgi:hypothetical protein